MSEWKDDQLGAVLEVKYGKDHKALDDGNIPCIGSGGIMRYVNDSLYDKVSILIPRKGSLNNIMYQDNPFWTVDTMFWSIINEEKVNPKFLFYQLTLIDYTNLNVGSAVPSLTVPVINEIDISLPEKDEQNAIAEVLSSLDDKIDLLHRQNQTLEQMAETLFRQWFVEEADEGWRSFGLLEVVKLVPGGTPKTSIKEYWDGDIKWISVKEISENYKSFIFNSYKTITEDGLNNSAANLFPKYGTIISARGTVGKIALLGEQMAFSQSNFGVLHISGRLHFFTFLLLQHIVEELKASAYGSVFDTITTRSFQAISVTLPDDDIIESFESEISPLFKKMFNNQTQIRTLTSLRDTLLPKLMSGEVRVKSTPNG